jgi:MYXO-CTERM domain-containing protein
VDINESVAAAAVSIDPAGNESRLSNPICVTRKLTNSFLDTCKATSTDNCGLNSCSIDPTGKGSALSAALFMLALAALIRRRGRA